MINPFSMNPKNIAKFLMKIDRNRIDW
ncbi:hypothetical protein LINPERPRIM_LOCUS9941 [Linum perenne]